MTRIPLPKGSPSWPLSRLLHSIVALLLGWCCCYLSTKIKTPSLELDTRMSSRIACLLMLSCALASAAKSQSVHIMGAGINQSCGKWLALRHSRDEFSMGNWALGYISGAVTYSDIGNILNNTDYDGVAYWLDRYCSQHPANPFLDAVTAFIAERRSR